MLIDHMAELVAAKRRSPGTLSMHRDKAGHLKRVFEYDAKNDEIVPFRIARIRAVHVDEYISQRRADGAKENTIAKELVTLRSALKLAKRKERWSGDVAAVLPSRFAPEYQPRERYLTPGELRALLAELPPDHSARAAFMVATSANRGESFRAMRADIGGAVFINGTKRTSRKRTVPIVTKWQASLLKHAAEHAQGTGGKLFALDGGFHGALLEACEALNIPHCTANDLRRTFAHWMRQSGMPRELVAAAMGHGSTAMVDKVYGKLDAGELAMLMSRALRGTPVAQTPAHRMDSVDASSSKKSRKSARSGAGEGTRTPTLLPVTDFESVCRRLPSPRSYKRKRDYAAERGTLVAQRGPSAEVIPLPLVSTRRAVRR